MIYERRIWDAAMDAAWASFARGDGGIGAVVTDRGGRILSVNGNRTDHGGRRQMEGSPIAHAEMEALQTIRGEEAAGGALWCTLQPCLMCWGACHWVEVATVRYLVPDPRWPLPAADRDPAAALALPVARHEQPARAEGVMAALIAFTVFAENLDAAGFGFYARRFPRIAERAQGFARSGRLADIARAGTGWREALEILRVGADEISEIAAA